MNRIGKRYQRARGFSLIELMIAVTLGAFLLFTITQIFASNKQSNNLQQSFARVQESGRTAVDILTRDIRMVDYWGCLRDRSKISNHLDTTDTDYRDWLDAAPVAGANDVTETLPAIGNKKVLPGSDTLTLRTSSDLCSGQGRLLTSSGGLTATTACPVAVGQAAIVSNCEAGELFTVTAFSKDSGVIEHDTTYNTGNAIKNVSGFSATSPAYGPEAKLLTPLKRIYFLAAGGNGVPALFRCDNDCVDAQELVPGVENLQVLYGEDVNNDGVVDVYRTAAAVVDMTNVRSVRATLTLRGNAIVGDKNNAPHNDGLLRRNYVVTADIRNRSLK